MPGYRLGVDLGTTFTSAAVGTGRQVDSVALGDAAPQIPSAVFPVSYTHLTLPTKRIV